MTVASIMLIEPRETIILMMFKILILQAWYALSDEALEKQIARDLMFRRFMDLSLSEAVPDHSTIWRFV
jgi:IS5 family transposase